MLSIAARVDRGCVRAKNDDRALLNGQIVSEGALAPEARSQRALIAVCDGVGGTKGGDLCAQLALETLAALPPPACEREALEAVRTMNQAVLDARATSGYAEMASTLVMACIDGERLLLAHAGDSRAYRMRRGRLAALTRDHSLQNELAPYLGEASGAREGTITRYLGMAQELTPEIAVDEGGLYAGDTLLLCSDGLYAVAGEERIGEILRSGGSPESLCARLIEAARAAGGGDNISAVIARKEG